MTRKEIVNDDPLARWFSGRSGRDAIAADDGLTEHYVALQTGNRQHNQRAERRLAQRRTARRAGNDRRKR